MTLAGILSAASPIAGASCLPMSKAGQVGHKVVREPPVVSYKKAAALRVRRPS
jgi:hypothetical protein